MGHLVKKKGARILAFLLGMSLCVSMYGSAFAAEKTEEKDADVVIGTGFEAVKGSDTLYRVELTAEPNKENASVPPSMLTFVLDGTDFMAIQDEDGIALDTKVRQSLGQTFEMLLQESNVNRENTYINIIEFGSKADGAVSLTQWAANPKATIEQLRQTTTEETAFVPLLDPNDANALNPILAQLIYADYQTLALKADAASGALDENYPISNAYFYGNSAASIEDGKTGAGANAYTSRFPLQSTGSNAVGALNLAVLNMDELKASWTTAEKYTPEEIAYALNYVMLVVGEDDSAAETQQWIDAVQLDSNATADVTTVIGGGMNDKGVEEPLQLSSTPLSMAGKNGVVWALYLNNDDSLYENMTKTLSTTDTTKMAKHFVKYAGAAVTPSMGNAFQVDIQLTFPAEYQIYQTEEQKEQFKVSLGTASLENQTISWSIDSLEQEQKATNVFYLELLPEYAEKQAQGEEYPLTFSMENEIGGVTFVKHAYVNPASGFEVRIGETPSAMSNASAGAPVAQTNDPLEENIENLPEAESVIIEADVTAEPMPEGNILDKNVPQQTPTTGEATNVVIGTIVGILVLGAVVVMVKKSKQNR